jgi:hypothetical protein
MIGSIEYCNRVNLDQLIVLGQRLHSTAPNVDALNIEAVEHSMFRE